MALIFAFHVFPYHNQWLQEYFKSFLFFYLCFVMTGTEIREKIIGYMKTFKPETIGIFGSYSRGDHLESSDIDIFIKFKKTINLFELAKIHRELTELLGKKVDIVTDRSLKNKKLRDYIFKDLEIIYG